MMFPRAIIRRVKHLLNTMPVVYLQGARQVGKTTLAKQLIQVGTMEHYFSFDDPAVLSAAGQDPVGFVRGLPLHTVLDEVQRVPAIMPVLKMRVDARREAGDLLLTGSANPLMLPHLHPPEHPATLSSFAGDAVPAGARACLVHQHRQAAAEVAEDTA